MAPVYAQGADYESQPTDPREPIITDNEFDETIPPIDEDPDALLGTVQDWKDEQQRLEAETQAKDVKNGVAGIPAVQDGDPIELIADAPVDDPEIDNPLEPLETFDVEPFDESRFTEADDSEQGAGLRYSYRIDGLENLDDQSDIRPISANDIKGRFAELSALEDGDGKATNGAMVSARMREDQQLLVDILSGQGYFDVSVNGNVELPSADGERLTVVLQVTPGKRYGLGTIMFEAEPVVPEDLVTKNFVPKIGEPIVAERVLAAEANLAVVLPEQGYPFVEIGQRDILLDPETGAGDYTLPIDIGPRSSFGDIVTTGTTAFDAEHINVISRFDKGELYDSRKVDDLRKALVATGLFSIVSVKPTKSDEAGPDGTEYATINVEQEAGPARTLAGSAGYGTGQGFRLEGSWTHRNLFPPEGALIASAVAGTQEQGASLSFRRSNAGRRDRTVEFGLSALHSDFDAYEAFTGRIGGRISYDSTPIWQKRFTYSFGFEVLGTNEQDFNLLTRTRDRTTYYLAALPGQVTFDTTDSLLDPTEGFRLSTKLSPEASLGSGAQIYGRGQVEGTAYYGAGENIVLAGRLRVGSIAGANRERIAPSRRFYAGGGGSVRGFGYQELGPKVQEPNPKFDPTDPDETDSPTLPRPIGGRSLVEAAAEVRYRFGDYGVVGFVDAGQVYTSSTPGFDNMRFGVGIGGRFYTNFGPLRLDVATPINRQPGESRVSVYISIGQAF
ncbi:autotransporter assembly complex protein TamA [Parasphingorhabdus halotolerans]|uniref:BamA/TamA family outer membrane protein n=1 Tax=Parasphingorhabdus halotolerans TaxID=2725558 RepID=A0A6H2DPA8_9SPHN|nr:BamA/TamA family outer membrane protein [Parasphingorhabdus halotolerans]QJB70174.1 BamA/TamA family outer membrane protein [Parasphingorhabdus halotolerans]